MNKHILLPVIPFILFSCKPSNEELAKQTAPYIQEAKEKGQKSLVLTIQRLEKENKFDSAQGLCVFFQEQFPTSKYISEINSLYSEVNKKEKAYKDSIKSKN